MPVKDVQNHEGVLTPHYVLPFGIRFSVNPVGAEELEVVKAHRREYGVLVERYNAMQKAFAAEKDFESAKGMKDLIKTVTQQVKCSTLVIEYFEKRNDLSTKDFPVELAEFLDYEFNAIELAWLERNSNENQ